MSLRVRKTAEKRNNAARAGLRMAWGMIALQGDKTSGTGTAMAMLEDFKHFAMKGNMIDLAVGVIIGAAFSKIVDSLVQDVIMPPISMLVGGLDFSNYYLPLKHQPFGLPLAEAKKLGAVFAYGNFLTVLLNFLILAFIIFQMVRMLHRLRTRPEPAAGPGEEIMLLREIRDALKK